MTLPAFDYVKVNSLEEASKAFFQEHGSRLHDVIDPLASGIGKLVAEDLAGQDDVAAVRDPADLVQNGLLRYDHPLSPTISQ